MSISFRDTMDSASLGKLQWRVAAMMTFVMFLEGIGFQIAAYAGPMLMTQWHLSKPELAPLLASAMVGMAVGTLIGSWSADRYGRKPTLVVCIVAYGLMTMICGSSSSPPAFIVWRFLTGLGFGAAFPVTMTVMSEWMPRRTAGKAIGIMTIGIPAGVILGALIGSWLLPEIGWRWFFGCVGAICLLFALLLFWALPESPSYLVLKGRHQQVHSLLAEAKIRVVGSAADAFHLELQQASDGTFFGRHNARMSLGMWSAYFCISLANYTIAAWLTIILVDMHLPLASALRGPEMYAFAAIIGSLAIGWFIVHLGSRLTMLALSIFTVGGGVTVAIVIMTLHAHALFASIFVGLAVMGFCMGGLQPAFYILAASVYPTHNRTTGVGVVAAVGRLGAILSSFVGGAVLALAHASGFFLLIGALAAVAAGGVLLVDQHMLRGRRANPKINSSEQLVSE